MFHDQDENEMMLYVIAGLDLIPNNDCIAGL
jgi:hypothetical protein